MAKSKYSRISIGSTMTMLHDDIWIDVFFEGLNQDKGNVFCRWREPIVKVIACFEIKEVF